MGQIGPVLVNLALQVRDQPGKFRDRLSRNVLTTWGSPMAHLPTITVEETG